VTFARNALVVIEVNGIMYEVGSGVKTADFYYSVDSGTTARAISAITAGDTLFRGDDLGFDLDTSDRVSQHYNVA